MLWQRLSSWRFWALVAPDLLRRIARFLESLAIPS